MIEDRERKTGEELLMIAVKASIYLFLVYLYINKPALYLNYPRIESLAGAMMVFLGPSLTFSILRLIIIYWYIRKHRFKSNIKDNFILGINRIISILNTVVFIVATLTLLKIELKDFIFSVSIVAAALAVTFKDYITNMINGLIIMFSDRLSLGDHIKVGEHEGKILDITLINVILQNEDSDMVIIPNSVIFSSAIVNQSKQNTKKLSIEFEVPIRTGQTPQTLEDRLNDVLGPYQDNIVTGGLTVKTISIHKDMAQFKVMVLLKHYDKLKERALRRAINTSLLQLSAPQAEEE